MKINELRLRDGLQTGKYAFDNISVICSEHNQVGKTSLMRCILYSLGYPIPSTKGLSFGRMEFSLSLTRDDGSAVCVSRRGSTAAMLENGKSISFSLPYQLHDLHKSIFGIENDLVLDNLLGAYYFDQEKGWTLLNRGKAIGSIRFTIEGLLRGLSDAPCIEEQNQLDIISQEIKKCQQMLSIAQYREELDIKEERPYVTLSEEISIEICRLKNRRFPLENELRRVKTVLQKNTAFRKYITSMRLRVRGPNGETIPVTEETILDFKENMALLQAKCHELEVEIAKINNKIGQLGDKLQEDKDSLGVKSSIQEFDAEMSRISVDRLAVENIIKGLREKQSLLSEKIKRTLANDVGSVKLLHESIAAYLKELGIDERHGRDIYTHDLKSLTGALLHLLVFAFKISYVKLVKAKTGKTMPILIDSPNGREVEAEHVRRMMEILRRDFPEHQVIIATIYDPKFQDQCTITLTNGIMHLGENATNLSQTKGSPSSV